MKSPKQNKGQVYLSPGKRIRYKQEWMIPNMASPLAMERWYYVSQIGWTRHDPGFHLERSEMDTLLLHFVLAGELEHKIRNRWHVVRAGDACLMELAEAPAQRNSGKQPVDFFWVSFNGPDLAWWIEMLKVRSHPVFNGVDHATMLHMFKDIVRLIEKRPFGYEPRVSMLLGGLLAELYAVRERENPLLEYVNGTGAFSPGILAALQGLHIGHSRPQTVQRIAGNAGMSPDRLARRFREEVGISPIAWLNRFRIQRARFLLETTRHPVAEIARSVGLPDPAYFSRLFHRETGISPRECRRQAAGNTRSDR